MIDSILCEEKESEKFWFFLFLIKYHILLRKTVKGESIVIEVCFEDEVKLSKFQKLLKRIKRRRWKVSFEAKKKEWCGYDIILLELKISEEEGKKLGKEWFLQWLERIYCAYPEEMIYCSPIVRSVFEIGEYNGKWITGYFLFAPFWKMVQQEHGLVEEKAEILFCDTKDNKAEFLLEYLAGRVRNCTIITDRGEKWEKICEEFYEETGMVIDIQKHVEQPEHTVIVDLNGSNAAEYGKWENTNLILCPHISRSGKNYLKDRVKGGRIVCGYLQSLCGMPVEETFAAIFMASKIWRIRQLINTGEIAFSEEEMQEIREEYSWRVEKLENLQQSYNAEMMGEI